MINHIRIGDISIDCTNPEELCNFYSLLTGWKREEFYGCPAIVSNDNLVILFMLCDFDYISPIWPEVSVGQQKQMHFNFQVNDLTSAVDEAISLGAKKPEQQFGGEHFVTLLDPAVHPFCLCKN